MQKVTKLFCQSAAERETVKGMMDKTHNSQKRRGTGNLLWFIVSIVYSGLSKYY